MKKLYAILLSVLCLATVAGCNKFLDMKPTNSLDSESSINSVADAQVALNGLMRQMLSGSFYGRNFFLYGDAKGGDFTVVSNGRGYDGLYTFGHTPTSGT
ncbi:MAG: RagB/SusD family nutrient uptake outer membrane protein, partial [Bacteroidales bacterium]|nr:RagB/SusD family nutrient uptake outer membrane protein [Bacteroidales bacterium]